MKYKKQIKYNTDLKTAIHRAYHNKQSGKILIMKGRACGFSEILTSLVISPKNNAMTLKQFIKKAK